MSIVSDVLATLHVPTVVPEVVLVTWTWNANVASPSVGGVHLVVSAFPHSEELTLDGGLGTSKARNIS